MCRNIHTLYHTEPPAAEEDIRLAALQYIRKVSGYQKPSRLNQAAFEAAVSAVSAATADLLASLQTQAPARPAKPHPTSGRA